LDASNYQSLKILYTNSINVVTNWGNLSGSSVTAENTWYDAPYYGTNNSIVSVRNSNDKKLGGSINITGSNLAVFAVMRASSLSAGRLISLGSIGGNDYSDTNGAAVAYGSGGMDLTTYRNNAKRSTITITTNLFVLGSTFDSNYALLWQDGVSGSTNGGGGVFNIGEYLIFGTLRQSQYQTIELSELILTTNSLSALDRQKYEGYLAWKWGTTNRLSASHPYKSARPTQ